MLSDEENRETCREMYESLNAPYGARCFLTQAQFLTPDQWLQSLNAPYGAWCFLTERQDNAQLALDLS